MNYRKLEKDLADISKDLYEVKVVEKSINEFGKTLTSFQLKYPRIIHSEFMTHRVFSRNASSSRAIPVKKMIEMVRKTPASPVHWGKNQSGMQANEELQGKDREYAQHLWLEAAEMMANIVEEMMSINVHKQVANRLLEPFQWISVIMTTSYIDNFYHLRSHKDAAPEIKVLSDMMIEADKKTRAKELKSTDFHLPYILDEERKTYPISELVKFSTARCARVSYLTHDNETPKPEDDVALYERLVGGDPIHASPTEHQARPMTHFALSYGTMKTYNGNFDHTWRQHRKFIEQKNLPIFLGAE